MMGRRSLALGALLVLATASVCIAVGSQRAPGTNLGLTTVTVAFDNVPIRDALQTLFNRSGGLFTVDPAVDGKVSAKLTNVSLETALRIILGQAKATFELRAGVYRIVPKLVPMAGSPNPVGEDIARLIRPRHPAGGPAAAPNRPLQPATAPPSIAPAPPTASVPGDSLSTRPAAHRPHFHRRMVQGTARHRPTLSADAPAGLVSADSAEPAATNSDSPQPGARTANVIGPGVLNLDPAEPKMVVGRQDQFQVWVRFANSPGATDIPSTASPDMKTTVATHMQIQLYGDPNVFQIDPPGMLDIEVPKAGPGSIGVFSTVWHVRPLVVGSHKIELRSQIPLDSGVPTTVANKPYVVYAEIGVPDTLQFWAKEYWQWPTFGGGTVSMATIAGVLVRRRRKAPAADPKVPARKRAKVNTSGPEVL